jgi:hypothetical protein
VRRAHAVVVLSRVRFRGRSLLLLPGEGRRGVDAVGVEDLKALRGVIAGTHVLLIRRWAVSCGVEPSRTTLLAQGAFCVTPGTNGRKPAARVCSHASLFAPRTDA